MATYKFNYNINNYCENMYYTNIISVYLCEQCQGSAYFPIRVDCLKGI